MAPRYDQVRLDPSKGHNALQQVIYPYPGPDAKTVPAGKAEGSWIYQDAWFSMGTFDAGRKIEYDIRKSGNGVYLFVIDGAFLYNGQRLETRDGLGNTDVEHLDLESAEQGSRILIMDVPMQNNIQ